MPEHKKSFIRRILELRIFLVVNLLVLGFLALSFGREFMRDWEINREIDALRTEAEELQAHNLEIAQLNNELNSEMFIEGEARLKLGLVKPGEQLVVVMDDEAADSGVVTETYAPVQHLDYEPAELDTVANPTKWWYYFFDHAKYQTLKIYGY